MNLKTFASLEWAALFAAFSAVAVTGGYLVVQLIDYVLQPLIPGI